MQKLREFIIAGIIGVCAMSGPLTGSTPDTLFYLPVGRGQTTGHVMDGEWGPGFRT